MKLNHLALAVALALGLQGCSLIPEFSQPQAPIDSAWPQGPAYRAETDTAATSLLWKDFFRDPKMQQLIGLALDNNRDLRVAALNVQAYRAQYRIQRSELFPSIDANASGSRQRLPADLATTGQSGIQSQYGLDVGISSYELDVFGRVRSLSSAALETYLATEQAQNSIRIGLIADVASAYLTWRTDQGLLEVTANTLASYTKSLGMIESSQREGTSSALDVRQARTLVDSARAQKILYTRQVAQDANALQLLLGANIPSDQVNGLALNADLLRDIPAGLPSDLLQKRPDIQEAEHRLLAANANIGAARAAFFPSISLTATAGSASSQLGDLLKGGQGSWSFVPQINVPIFNGGRLRANLDYATIQKDIGVAQYEKSIQTAFQEVADGLAAKGTYGEQLQAQSDLVQASQEYFDMAQQRYDEGVDNYLTLLDAQRQLLSSRQKLLSDRLLQLDSQVQLYKALGGGWEQSALESSSVKN
ncbi:efflux transporter outer membrane subunit [Pseudomonas sp. PAMC 29040]|uniref:efflux transporter outer membrane subunit n=1 Tax=Pseudomonas sp. PAMC 29040 TaxID=2498450 RepID=UPI000FBC6854|nr:efflux transporter outer membrane subunit [Pseudomonas sp. PAMC 29040]RUT42428.1 efflux transporter outer membrane subunit [Pseudomonas sp. PAMC 29040]